MFLSINFDPIKDTEAQCEYSKISHLKYNTQYDSLSSFLGTYYVIKGFTNEAARLKGYGGLDKGEPFQIKGFTKGENAEFFGKIKGFSPVNHFGFTLICQAMCILEPLIN